MSNVVDFFPNNAAENPDNVLEQAKGQYQDVFILGYDADGDIDARSSLGFSKAEILFLIESFKHRLMSGEYDE